MKEFATFIVAGILVEGVTETLKQLRTDGKINSTMLMSIIVGEVFAFATGLDILDKLGFEMFIPFVGVFVTGLLISRGSNYIADLVTRLTEMGNAPQIVEVPTIHEEREDLETLLDELENSLD